MADTWALTSALRIVQYVSPIAIVAFFLLATLVSFLRLEILEQDISARLRKTISVGLGLHTVLYIAQAGLVIDLIFFNPSIYGSDSTNIHALSSALVWIIVSTSLLTFDTSAWYPYYGSWLLSLAIEVVILALSLAIRLPRVGPELAVVLVQGTQILTLLFVTAIFFTWTALKAEEKAKDEERAPLLLSGNASNTAATIATATAPSTAAHTNDSQQNDPDTGGKKPDTNASGADACGDDDDDNDDDDDDDGEYDWIKEEQKKKEQMKQRLKEEGGLFAYLKGFSIFFPYIWPARSFRLKMHLFGVVLCMIAGRVLNPLEPRQLGILVDTLATGDTGKAFAALGIYILLNAASSNIGILRTWLWLPIETNTAARMEKASYNHIMELSCDFHDSKRTGEVFEAMRQGQSVVDLIETFGFTLIPEIADLIIACVYFYWLFDAYMVLVGLATGVLYVCISAWTTSRSGDRRREMNQAYRQKSQIKYDTVNGWKTVSYFNRVPHSQSKFGGAIDHANKVFLSYRLFWNWMYSFQGIIIDMGLFCACILAVYEIMFQGKPIGRFVTLMNYWGRLTGPLISLSHTSSSLIFDLIDAESLLRIWRRTPSVEDGPNELELADGHVKFDKVSFKYESKKETIDDLSFDARPGQTVALVGETGAGKSTILKLLFRFYDIKGGQISIDNQDIRNVTLQSLRENIGVVPQDPALFNVTIMDNLRYARLDATDEEIHDACKAAAVHDKIMTFTKGYSSKVGERGVKLSGGELQRVAIARAILKNPPIVLLDEATSSVDSETETKIQEGLKRLCYNRTTFVVAHRLSTIQHADQILVIKDGKILEQGTPRELLEKKGKYYSLWTKQMGIFDPFAPKKDKKSGEDNDDSSDGTRTAEDDLIDLKGDLRDGPKKEASTGEVDKHQPYSSTDTKKPELKISTGEEAGPAESGSMLTSPSKSPIKFRPNAPEFVPLDHRDEPHDEHQSKNERTPSNSSELGFQPISRTSSAQGIAGNRRSVELSRSDPGPHSSSSSSSSRPGSSSSRSPGLLALQQAVQQAGDEGKQ